MRSMILRNIEMKRVVSMSGFSSTAALRVDLGFAVAVDIKGPIVQQSRGLMPPGLLVLQRLSCPLSVI